MNQLLAALIYLSALLLIAACSPQSTTLRAERPLAQQEGTDVPSYPEIPEQKFNWKTLDGGQNQYDFNPQVDILFVTDNSDSMKGAQENLAKNINRFASGIIKNRMIDYHIGVVATWDSTERFLNLNKDSYQVGELHYVKDADGKNYNKRYLTKAESSSLLAPSINIGITPYAKGGPEIEEFFSPITAAIAKSGHGAVNDGFFRPDAQLIVIIMTDADDSTQGVSPEQMAQSLFDFKGGQQNKVAVYGVLVSKDDPDSHKDYDLRISYPKYHKECFDIDPKTKKPVRNQVCQTGFGPDRLEQFIVSANPDSGTPDQIRSKYIMRIFSPSFGDDLVKIGDDITSKTLAKTILLSERPRLDEATQKLQLRVRYGTADDLAAGKGQVIPQGATGWLYNPDDNSVQISGKVQYQYKDGARFAVDIIPLTVKQ